jgi:hypothetical protein
MLAATISTEWEQDEPMGRRSRASGRWPGVQPYEPSAFAHEIIAQHLKDDASGCPRNLGCRGFPSVVVTGCLDEFTADPRNAIDQYIVPQVQYGPEHLIRI